MTMNKKGQALGGLSASIIAIVAAVIILVLGIVIIQTLRNTDTLAKANSGSQVNDTTGVAVTELGVTLDNSPGCEISSISNVVRANNTLYVIAAANYSFTGCRIRYTAGVNSQVNNTIWNVTYSYTYGDEGYVAANSSLTGLGDFADFVPLIVLALAASVIIGLILAGFAFRGGQR